jgi:hypothetical protein
VVVARHGRVEIEPEAEVVEEPEAPAAKAAKKDEDK